LIERLQQAGGGEEAGLTVKELAELYFHYQLAGKSSYELERRTFYKELEFLLNRRVTSLKKIELIAWHASRRAAPAQANRNLGVLRTMANWAIGLDILKGPNPTAGIRKFPMRSRERAVEPEEMPQLMWTLSTAPPEHRTFFYLCLFTAARSGEVRRMECEHVNLPSRIWFKPTSGALAPASGRHVMGAGSPQALLANRSARLRHGNGGGPFVLSPTCRM
jgi:integrase